MKLRLGALGIAASVLHAGIYILLNKDAPDYNPCVGISFRY